MSEPVTRVEMDAALGQLETRISGRIDGLSAELREFKAEVKAEIGGIKAEISGIKAEISGIKAEISEFKAEIREFKAEIKTEIGGIKAEISNLLVTLDERFDRKMERQENRMTGTFWKWARPREIQQRDDRARLNAADTQLAGLEERVTLIESRLTDLEFGPQRNQPEA